MEKRFLKAMLLPVAIFLTGALFIPALIWWVITGYLFKSPLQVLIDY